MRAKVREVKDELKKRMHNTIQDTGRWLRTVVTGHYQYYGVPGNSHAMSEFRYLISQRWLQTLRRRGQKGLITWDKMRKLLDYWLPPPQICHEYPNKRFGVTI